VHTVLEVALGGDRPVFKWFECVFAPGSKHASVALLNEIVLLLRLRLLVLQTLDFAFVNVGKVECAESVVVGEGGLVGQGEVVFVEC